MPEILLPLIPFAPLFLGLLLARALPLSLRKTQGVYVLLGALLVFLMSLYFPGVSVYALGASLVVGELCHFLLLGLLGEQLTVRNHGAFLLGVGLFPWALGFVPSLLYLFLFVVFTIGLSTFLTLRAGKPFGLSTLDPRRAARELAPEDFEVFKGGASLFLGTPFFLAALGTLLLFSFS